MSLPHNLLLVPLSARSLSLSLYLLFPPLSLSLSLSSGGYFISFMRMSRLLMERDDYNVKSVFEKWVSSGRWRRFPDDYSTYYSAGSELPEIEKEGVTITFQKV